MKTKQNTVPLKTKVVLFVCLIYCEVVKTKNRFPTVIKYLTTIKIHVTGLKLRM